MLLNTKSLSESVYLHELAAADLGGVVVVGEGHAQLAALHLHSGLKNAHFIITQGIRVHSSLPSVLDAFPSSP